MAPAPPHLMKSPSRERRQDAACREFGQTGHRLGGDLDLDSDERLTARFAALAAKRVDIELQRVLRAGDRLPPRAAIHVAARHFRDRGDKPSVCLALDCDHVSQVHGGSMPDVAAADNVRRRASRFDLHLGAHR